MSILSDILNSVGASLDYLDQVKITGQDPILPSPFLIGEAKPQHLPTQSLDYITGYLAAFGAMEALKRRALNGGSYLVRVSLAQTAHWLKKLGRVSSDFSHCQIPTHEDIKRFTYSKRYTFWAAKYLAPVLKMSETPPHWSRLTVPLGTDSIS